MHQLKRDSDLSPSKLKHRKYMAVNLVIIDEFGYQQLDREESHLFFRVVNYRYGKGSSTAITTNKGIASWPSVLADDEVLAGAILDRLLHCATVLNIQGRSYRLKELDAQVGQQSITTTTGVSEPEVANAPVGEPELASQSGKHGKAVRPAPPSREVGKF